MEEIDKMKILIERGYKYNYETGEFFNRFNKKCNTIDSYGYQTINTRYNKKALTVKAHRFAWFYFYTVIPDNIIDHIDRNKSNNKISNLRISTTQFNGFNRNAKGYYWNKSEKKYKSQIIINGEFIHLGYFSTEENARLAYLEAKKKYHKITL